MFGSLKRKKKSADSDSSSAPGLPADRPEEQPALLDDMDPVAEYLELDVGQSLVISKDKADEIDNLGLKLDGLIEKLGDLRARYIEEEVDLVERYSRARKAYGERVISVGKELGLKMEDETWTYLPADHCYRRDR
jgi:hypothetical protein